jgi:hypothetical protein
MSVVLLGPYVLFILPEYKLNNFSDFYKTL